MHKVLIFLLVAIIAIFVVYPLLIGMLALMLSVVIIAAALMFIAVVIVGIPGCIKTAWEIAFK